jgi:cAMP phosphodiesterase
MAERSIKISLPAPLIRDLIEKDAEVTAQITRGAAGNVANMVSDAVIRKLQPQIDETVSKELETSSWSSRGLKKEIKAKITKAVRAEVTNVMNEEVRRLIEEYIGKIKVDDMFRALSKELIQAGIKAEIAAQRDEIRAVANQAVGDAIKEKLNL